MTYLLRVDDIHNHTALQHLGQTGLDGEVRGPVGARGAIGVGAVLLFRCHDERSEAARKGRGRKKKRERKKQTEGKEIRPRIRIR